MDLFTVLAEIDGTGVLLAYCSVETLASKNGTRRTIPGAVAHLLDQFLRPLKTSGFSPTFFGCDKDMTKIAAIYQVWPDTAIQLCYWYAKRAIQARLKDSK
jgi:transposase-like protein